MNNAVVTDTSNPDFNSHRGFTERYTSRRSLDQGLSPIPNSTISPKETSAKDRSISCKLLRFPASTKSFWDKTPLGCSESINWCNNRTPVVCLNKSVLLAGNRLISSSNNTGSKCRGILRGTIFVSERDRIMTFSLKTLVQSDVSSNLQSLRLVPMECQVPIEFFLESECAASAPETTFQEESLSWFCEPNGDDNGIFHRYLLFKASCELSGPPNSRTCSVQFNISTIPFVFNLMSIRPISIIPTALSMGLSETNGIGFLHGEPKSGYVTMDKSRRLILVLDSDPKASSLPLVGLWISGVESTSHPFMWTVCTRYFTKTGSIENSVPQTLDSFLVLVYKKQLPNPVFYECSLKSSITKQDLLFYTAKTSCLLAQSADEEQNESLVTNFTRIIPTERLDNIAVVQEKETSVASPHQQSYPLDCDRSGANTSDNRLTNSNREATNFRLPKEDEMWLASPILKSTAALMSPTAILVQSPDITPSANFYNVLVAQEQELRSLREQLDTLIREQRESQRLALSVSSSKETPSASGPSPSRGHSKTTECVATMTSFVVAPDPTPPCRCKCSKNSKSPAVSKSNNAEVPESLLRGAQLVEQTDLSNSMAGEDTSLIDLRLTAITQPSESHLSSLRVDMYDFPESVRSSFRQSNILSSDVIDNDTLGWSKEKPTGSLQPISESLSQDADQGIRTSFYDSLLKKIQDMLSEPDSSESALPSAEESSLCRRISKERSVFDSVLIPHLNYLTLYRSDLDNDHSSEFNDIAHKYLKILNKLPLPL